MVPEERSVLDVKNDRLYGVGVISASLLIGITIIVYALFLRDSSVPEQTVAIPTPTLQPPTPTIYPRSSISLSVLNGSGVPGAAGKLKEKLGALGYTDIAVGNASARTGSIVQVGAFDAQKAVILNDIAGFVPDAEIVDGDSTGPVVITIGK